MQQDEEDSVLKDFNTINKKSPFVSKGDKYNEPSNTNDLEYSDMHQSPLQVGVKGFDRQLEKVINEQQQKNHEEDWQSLIHDIDQS